MVPAVEQATRIALIPANRRATAGAQVIRIERALFYLLLYAISLSVPVSLGLVKLPLSVSPFFAFHVSPFGY